MNVKIQALFEEIIKKSSDLKLSILFTKSLSLAKTLKDADFENWILLESAGYVNTNSAYLDQKVPKYRNVPGQYYNNNNVPIIINDPKLEAVLHYRLRESIAELEEMVKVTAPLLEIKNTRFLSILSEKLGIDFNSFAFSPASVQTVLADIRVQLINKLFELQERYCNQANLPVGLNDLPNVINNLHPIVYKVAGTLYKNGHYRQAILDTYIALIHQVKVKSGMHNLDNTPLMQNAFSIKNPSIKVSDDSDEQLGFMWLFSGAVMGIRNPKAHRLVEQNDPQRALEWLSFASVLLRVLDDSEANNNQV